MNTKPITTIGAVVLGLYLALVISGCQKAEDSLSFTSEYQAVFLDNGQVFFGKLENPGSAHPILREVYYIGRQASPDGKEEKNILLKRGSEWHGPEYMVITASHIAMIEPVSPASRLAGLIKDLKAQGGAPPAKEQPPAETGK